MEYGDSDDADADMMHAPENAWAAAEGGHIHTLHDVLQQRKASLGKLSFPFFSIFPMMGLHPNVFTKDVEVAGGGVSSIHVHHLKSCARVSSPSAPACYAIQ